MSQPIIIEEKETTDAVVEWGGYYSPRTTIDFFKKRRIDIFRSIKE